MNCLAKPLAFALTAATLMLATPLATAAAIGDELPAVTLKDQADTAHTLDSSVQRIYANADRKGDGMMKAAMAKLDQSVLDAQHAVVIADISGAPGFVKSIIRSSLKDRRYTTWLDVSGNTRSLLPYRANQIAVIELDQRRIVAVRYVADAEALRRELAPPAPPTKPQ